MMHLCSWRHALMYASESLLDPAVQLLAYVLIAIPCLHLQCVPDLYLLHVN